MVLDAFLLDKWDIENNMWANAAQKNFLDDKII